MLRPVPAGIAEWWKEELAKMQAEYLADTGEKMPTKAVEMTGAARSAGFTAGEALTGEYTLADVREMAVATRSMERRQAAAVVEALRTDDALVGIDRYDRAIRAMSIVAKKAVTGLLERNAIHHKRTFIRKAIARFAGCSDRQMKDVIEREIRPIENSLGFTIIEAKRTVGCWLTLEGVEVAKRIAANNAQDRGRFPVKNR